MKPPTKDAALKKWNIKSTIEEEMLQHIKKVKTPKEAWDTFIMIFWKKNNTATASKEWAAVSFTIKHDS